MLSELSLSKTEYIIIIYVYPHYLGYNIVRPHRQTTQPVIERFRLQYNNTVHCTSNGYFGRLYTELCLLLSVNSDVGLKDA